MLNGMFESNWAFLQKLLANMVQTRGKRMTSGSSPLEQKDDVKPAEWILLHKVHKGELRQKSETA